MQILAVVVRYNTPLESSETIQSLCTAFAEKPGLLHDFHVFLWDNTPEALVQPALPFQFEYRHTGENLGVSGAYNRAMDFADQHGCPWLLTLDQDTKLDVPYLERILALSRELLNEPGICSIVPFVCSHGELVSPRLLGRLNRNVQIDPGFRGVMDARAYAVNSASVMRVASLRAIGGYSQEFWLDLSDVYVFERMHERGGRVFVAGDLRIEHSVAGMNFQSDMVPERYRVFLAAESAYLALYSSRFENAFQTFRLAARAARQYLQYKDRTYFRITLNYLLDRLLQRRALLLKKWRSFLLEKRQIPSPKATAPSLPGMRRS